MSVPGLTGTLESALYADDLDAAEAFYAGILGLPVIARRPGRHVFFRVGGSVLLVFAPSATRIPAGDGALPVPVHGAKGPGHYCFAVEEGTLDRIRDSLERAGVEIEADFTWPGSSARSVYVRDPAGNSVEFGEARLWFDPEPDGP